MSNLPRIQSQTAMPLGAGPHARFGAGKSSSARPPLLMARALEKMYYKAKVMIPVLRGVDLDVRRGEFLAITGQSGSGKSTLLHLLGLLDAPAAGEVLLDSVRIDNLPAADRDRLRNRKLGMIFQFYHLLPELTTLENVLSPRMIQQGAWNYFWHRRAHRASATKLLELVGLAHRLEHRPRELSGGEMQRAAIARALVNQPELLLADEPTGNLDRATGRDIVTLLRTLNRQEALTIVMVTHDETIAAEADRVVRLVDGRVQAA
jgi:lipoprotein-releasing system ATP-binding protein